MFPHGHRPETDHVWPSPWLCSIHSLLPVSPPLPSNARVPRWSAVSSRWRGACVACQSRSISVLFWSRVAQSRAPVPSPVTTDIVRTMKKDVQKPSEMSPRGSVPGRPFARGTASPPPTSERRREPPLPGPPAPGDQAARGPGGTETLRSLRTPSPWDETFFWFFPSTATPTVFLTHFDLRWFLLDGAGAVLYKQEAGARRLVRPLVVFGTVHASSRRGQRLAAPHGWPRGPIETPVPVHTPLVSFATPHRVIFITLNRPRVLRRGFGP